MDFDGATLDQYDKVLELMQLHPGGRAPDGALFHWCTKTDNGIRVTDVWDSREQFERFAQGPHRAEEEARHAGPQVGQGPQEEGRGAAAARRLHARVHDHAEETELGASQGGAGEADQRHGGRRLHPG